MKKEEIKQEVFSKIERMFRYRQIYRKFSNINKMDLIKLSKHLYSINTEIWNDKNIEKFEELGWNLQDVVIDLGYDQNQVAVIVKAPSGLYLGTIFLKLVKTEDLQKEMYCTLKRLSRTMF